MWAPHSSLQETAASLSPQALFAGSMREEIMPVFLYHSSERLVTHALNKILLALIKPAGREILAEWTFPAAGWRSATLSFVDSHERLGGVGNMQGNVGAVHICDKNNI